MKNDLEKIINDLEFKFETGTPVPTVYPCQVYDRHGRLIAEISAKEIVLRHIRRLNGTEV